MNCLQCNTKNDSDSNYCKKCGAELTLETLVTQNKRSRDIILLLIYICWHFVTLMIYAYLLRVVLPDLGANGRANEIAELLKTADWFTSVIDATMLIVSLFLLKSKNAKIFFSIYLLLRIGLMAINL